MLFHRHVARPLAVFFLTFFVKCIKVIVVHRECFSALKIQPLKQKVRIIMLDYVLRIRDLIHGTILFTKEEMDLINHPFFQRLRHIRQSDVGFYVYPSLNTSRFEHTLGTCRGCRNDGRSPH